MSYVLNDIGMVPNKSNKVVFPDIPKEPHSHFIRGVFDGDGCIHNRNGKSSHKISITETHDLCCSIKDIFDDFGCKSNIREASNHNGITSVFEIWDINSVKMFLDYIYKDAELYMQRKHDRYIEFINKYFGDYYACSA